jgi:hypothetical protein
MTNQASQKHGFKNIYSLISNPCFLLSALSNIRKNAVIGLDDVPAKNVTFASLLKTAQEPVPRQ